MKVSRYDLIQVIAISIEWCLCIMILAGGNSDGHVMNFFIVVGAVYILWGGILFAGAALIRLIYVIVARPPIHSKALFITHMILAASSYFCWYIAGDAVGLGGH